MKRQKILETMTSILLTKSFKQNQTGESKIMDCIKLLAGLCTHLMFKIHM